MTSRRHFFLRTLGVLFAVAMCAHASRLSPLAPEPDWSRLDAYQQTITRGDFVRLINEVYSPDGGFWKYCQLGDDRVLIFSDTTRLLPLATLYFAPDAESRRARPVEYTPEKKITESTDTLPLKGTHICLDPGHIGGAWAKLEERFFQVGTDAPIEEADLNWITCERIAEKLTALGAKVSWTKQRNEPATFLRPTDLRDVAILAITETSPWPLGPLDPVRITQQVDDRTNILFYRSAEIFARAENVAKLRPDLTLCVHYNAAAWGDPKEPKLVDRSKLVFFVNGVYSEGELAFDDQKLNLLLKLLDNVYPLERRGAEAIAEEMTKRFKMDAETYPGSTTAKKIGTVPGVFARNLLANRAFPGPVIFVEGPYMNARNAYARLVAGDYEGTRKVDGVEQRSVFRDYADAVVDGVVRYFKGK